MITHFLNFSTFLFFCHSIYSQDNISKNPPDFKTVLNESFGSDKISRVFEVSPKGNWLISKGGCPGKSLKYIGTNQQNSFDIKPVTKAFIRETGFSAFIFDADIEQCGQDHDCRDICIIFNHIDENNYHFIHLASITGELCHGVFSVKDGELRMLTTPSETPVIWGVKQWFNVRIENGLEEKKLKVFLNNNLLWDIDFEVEMSGRIGIGAKDGSAKIDNLKITAPFTTNVNPLY